LDLCTKQVVSARACGYQCLPYNSSGIKLFGKRIVQADSCLHSEQIDTLFISVGGQEGVWRIWAGGPKFTRDCQRTFFYASWSQGHCEALLSHTHKKDENPPRYAWQGQTQSFS